MEAIMAYRWEIDLSPGSEMAPDTRAAGEMRFCMSSSGIHQNTPALGLVPTRPGSGALRRRPRSAALHPTGTARAVVRGALVRTEISGAGRTPHRHHHRLPQMLSPRRVRVAVW